MEDYEYEIWRDGAVIATGRIQLPDQPTPGETLNLGANNVRIEDVLALRGSRRLILSAC